MLSTRHAVDGAWCLWLVAISCRAVVLTQAHVVGPKSHQASAHKFCSLRFFCEANLTSVGNAPFCESLSGRPPIEVLKVQSLSRILAHHQVDFVLA